MGSQAALNDNWISGSNTYIKAIIASQKHGYNNNRVNVS
jgi:hypothetical protein